MEGITDVRASIERRLAELNTERKALEAALAALSGVSGSSTPRRAPRSGKPSSGGRRRGRPAARSAEALALVRAQPGVTIPAMAKQMGIAAPYLYRVLPKLIEEGKVRKDGAGWFPTDRRDSPAVPQTDAGEPALEQP